MGINKLILIFVLLIPIVVADNAFFDDFNMNENNIYNASNTSIPVGYLHTGTDTRGHTNLINITLDVVF